MVLIYRDVDSLIYRHMQENEAFEPEGGEFLDYGPESVCVLHELNFRRTDISSTGWNDSRARPILPT
jgi:hypothetical protein